MQSAVNRSRYGQPFSGATKSPFASIVAALKPGKVMPGAGRSGCSLGGGNDIRLGCVETAMRAAQAFALIAALTLGPGATHVSWAPAADSTAGAAQAAETRPAPPATPALSLRDTGLYVDGFLDRIHPDNLEFTPRYALWADGATKRRWLNLPVGTYIDATRPDAWEFPPGTRLWKEFSVEGRRIETRLIERRPDKSWSYLSYVWNSAGSDAVLAPVRGVALSDVGGPAGRYIVPSRGDCVVCHEGAAVPVLGFSAVQLSRERERDPSTGVAVDVSLVDLEGLVAKGLLRNLPPDWLARPPQIAARSPVERAALGYLHANCGHCHNHNGAPAAVRLVLAQTAVSPEESRDRVLRSAVNARSSFRPPGTSGEVLVIAPGRPHDSMLDWRMRSRDPLRQMPPLGTLVPDPEGTDLIARWISTDLQPPQESAK
jgi:hypothetical protein